MHKIINEKDEIEHDRQAQFLDTDISFRTTSYMLPHTNVPGNDSRRKQKLINVIDREISLNDLYTDIHVVNLF